MTAAIAIIMYHTVSVRSDLWGDSSLCMGHMHRPSEYNRKQGPFLLVVHGKLKAHPGIETLECQSDPSPRVHLLCWSTGGSYTALEEVGVGVSRAG